MDPLTLGLVLAGLGIAGTLITLFALSLIADLLKRLFPPEAPGARGQGPAASPVAVSAPTPAPQPPTPGEAPTPAPRPPTPGKAAPPIPDPRPPTPGPS